MKIKLIIMSKLTICKCCSFKILAANCSIRMSHIYGSPSGLTVLTALIFFPYN